MLLESERLELQEIAWEDAENIHALHSIPAVDEFNTLGLPRNLDETKAFMAPLIADRACSPRKTYCWVIHRKQQHDFLGLAGMAVSAEKFRSGEIYYKLLPRYWGNGYATETARTLIAWGFSQLHLHRIEAGVAVDNLRSIHVLEKVGMTREGRGRKILPIRGVWKDNYRYAIVEDDARYSATCPCRGRRAGRTMEHRGPPGMKSIEESIAQAMDCETTALVPFLPYILQDFLEMGSSADALLAVIRENTTKHQELEILDLGCGKGAVATRLAKELDCTCTGIDAVREFIDNAKAAATEMGTSDRCRFIAGDARELIKGLGRFDVIILGSVGPIFGTYSETLTLLKEHVAPQGIIILDDGYMDDESGFTHEFTLKKSEMLDQINAAGMKVINEYRGVEDDSAEDYEIQLRNIKKRCGELAAKHPEKKLLFEDYIKKQESEYAFLRNNMISATMVVGVE